MAIKRSARTSIFATASVRLKTSMLIGLIYSLFDYRIFPCKVEGVANPADLSELTTIILQGVADGIVSFSEALLTIATWDESNFESTPGDVVLVKDLRN